VNRVTMRNFVPVTTMRTRDSGKLKSIADMFVLDWENAMIAEKYHSPRNRSNQLSKREDGDSKQPLVRRTRTRSQFSNT